MVCFDYFLLMKFHFFQHYFPEVESVYTDRKYGYNIIKASYHISCGICACRMDMHIVLWRLKGCCDP